MDNIIEKLKDKDYVRAFGLLSPEEQKCLIKVGKANLIVYSHSLGWCNTIGGDFLRTETYAIKPDYQPEPEYVNLEIEEFADGENTKWLGVWNTPEAFFLPHQFTHLHCLPSLLNFQGFFAGDMRLRLDEVSTHMEGKPYARFRK